MQLSHLKVYYGVRPAIVLCGLVAGFGMRDGWLLWSALLAAWFVGASPWEPYASDVGVVRRKSNEAPD